MSIKQAIAARLKQARLDAGLTQAQAAEQMGLHRPSISEIEAGRRGVSVQELVNFSTVYKTCLYTLTFGDSIDEPHESTTRTASGNR